MEQETLGTFLDKTKLDLFSKDELILRYHIVTDELTRVIKENYHLRDQKISDEQLNLLIQEQLGELRQAMFGTSSERYKKPEEKKKNSEPPKPRVKKPSERYPNIPVREQIIAMNPAPNCTACGLVTTDSGMTEDSEQLTVIPKKYEITKFMRTIFR